MWQILHDAGIGPRGRDFRAGAREFFVSGRPGPKTAPGKDATRPRVIELRAAGHSIDEIAAALAAEGTPLNRIGIAEVIAEQRLPRMWRRPDAERGGPTREVQARAEAAHSPTSTTSLPDCPRITTPNRISAPDGSAMTRWSSCRWPRRYSAGRCSSA